ncbi:hypothetical protein OKW40_006157 [Paraburkholderia sp. RAU6.4a]|uniref:hypothetical protein n=1 Tax=Paraburkholderia sp. RAU6.4a TaxID=2991067 RepID=UPI003D24969F
MQRKQRHFEIAFFAELAIRQHSLNAIDTDAEIELKFERTAASDMSIREELGATCFALAGISHAHHTHPNHTNGM